MQKYIIIIRNPSNDRIMVVSNPKDEDYPEVFDTEEDAEQTALQVAAIEAGWPYLIAKCP